MTNSDTLYMKQTTLLVLSGPSGAGKTTIKDKLIEEIPETKFSVSMTTREKRDYEHEGQDYKFITKEKFEEYIKNNKFIEWEEVHGHYYGTPAIHVEEYGKKPALIIFDIDVKGAMNVKKKYPDTIMIYLKLPDRETALNRLRKRNTDSDKEIDVRMHRMEEEDRKSINYDHIIISRTVDETVDKIMKLIRDFQDK